MGARQLFFLLIAVVVVSALAGGLPFAEVGAMFLGVVLGRVSATSLIVYRRPEFPTFGVRVKRPYAADWHPLVTNTEDEVKVHVTKRGVPGQRLAPEAVLLVESLDPKADNFDEALETALGKAAKRATTLSFAQNTHNEYDQ